MGCENNLEKQEEETQLKHVHVDQHDYDCLYNSSPRITGPFLILSPTAALELKHPVTLASSSDQELSS